MEARYRKDYDGEFVIAKSHWAQATKDQKREWIPNPIENHHISGRAVVVGSQIDREVFDYTRLQRHRGGLLGNKRLQTYSSGQLWETMVFDFFVTININVLSKMQKEKYSDNNIVFTSARNCINNPEKFYLIPYFTAMDDLAIAVYLAAFDGHEEIFLLGYNNDTPFGNNSWIDQINAIFSAYNSTKFYLIGSESNMPDMWRNNSNVSCMDYRTWTSYCDV